MADGPSRVSNDNRIFEEGRAGSALPTLAPRQAVPPVDDGADAGSPGEDIDETMAGGLKDPAAPRTDRR